ncbi:hypothetical protein LIER_17213 [Lithospermum erythrorhizon]|uniref:Uncharacterized protein n=1 Tax=Lithospermum erythrorhizon TaxID=34254 RepID=A0AAV3QEW9_LITER
MAKYGGLYMTRSYDSMTEARGRLDKCHPGWTALRPCQMVHFLAFKESTSRSKDYEAWIDNVLSCGSILSSPGIPGKGKGLLVHLVLTLKRKASPVSVSEDKDPKHSRGIRLEGSGSTHSSQPVEVSSSLSGGICTEVVDTGDSHAGTNEIIPPSPEAALVLRDGTCPGTASAEEHPPCMTA